MIGLPGVNVPFGDAAQRVGGRRDAGLGVVALDELDPHRDARRRVATHRAAADRAHRGVQVENVGADQLGGVGLLDVATVRAHPGGADRVVDQAVELDVQVDTSGLDREDLDEGRLVAADDLEVEPVALGDVRDPERAGVAVRHVLDVDLDLGRGERAHHVDLVDDDVEQRPVADQDRVPALLEVEDRRVAPDLAVVAVVTDVVAGENRPAAEVVDDVVEPDGPGDDGAERERCRGAEVSSDVDQCGDHPVRVDLDPRVGLAEQDGSGLPVNVPVDLSGLTAAAATAVEGAATAVTVVADVEAVAERVDLEESGPQDRVLATHHLGERLRVRGGAGVGVSTQAGAGRVAVGEGVQPALLGGDRDPGAAGELRGAGEGHLGRAADDGVGASV